MRKDGHMAKVRGTYLYYVFSERAKNGYHTHSACCSSESHILISIYLILSAALVPGFTEPLAEMTTRNIKIIMFLGSRALPVRRANNLTAIYEPIV
jgi:hypothetical protein